MSTYTAWFTNASDCVPGEYCDVLVAADEISGYREGEGGQETPDYTMGSIILEPTPTVVRVDDEKALDRGIGAAEVLLTKHGWSVSGEWTIYANGAHAPVVRQD